MTPPPPSPRPGLPGLPGRVRYRVVAFAVALAGVTYLDRICISVLAPSMMRDLSLNRMEMSYVFSAFAIAYAAFEIPSAWWGERVGTRRVLTRIVCWWSAFTMATGLVTSYTVLLLVRFLFGAGEAGAWPNAARTFSRWIPVNERGRVQGVFFAGAFLAGGLTPAIVSFLEPRIGWRGVFMACGAVGLVWAVSWYRWFRDEPSEHPQVGAEELALIVNGRGDGGHHHASASVVRKFVGNPSAWALCLGYFSNSYGSYFVMTWLPTYLAEARGFAPGALALFAGLPMLLGVGSNLVGGVTTDWLCAKFGIASRPRRDWRGELRGGGGHDAAGGHRTGSAPRRHPARRRQRLVDVRSRRALGRGHRHRRRKLRRAQRRHEHDRPDRKYLRVRSWPPTWSTTTRTGRCRSTSWPRSICSPPSPGSSCDHHAWMRIGVLRYDDDSQDAARPADGLGGGHDGHDRDGGGMREADGARAS